MKTKLVLLAAAIAACSAWPAFADGDPVKGAKVFKKCKACHSFDEGQKKTGPHLVGVIDRPVASVEGFKYSKSMEEFAADGQVWDVETLTLYLQKPKGLVPKTKMAFAGLKKEADIDNLMAYLADPAAADKQSGRNPTFLSLYPKAIQPCSCNLL